MNKQQPSMSGGELAPVLHGRTDLGKFASGLAACRNAIVIPSGGVSNRSGHPFVAEVKDSTKATRLIPFQFNTTQTYALEFGNLYIRVHKGGAQVTEATKVITAATKASPCVLTSAAHGLSDGDEIYVTAVVGMTQLNGRNFKVKNVAANTMELTDLQGNNIASTSYTTYSSAGTLARIYTLTSTYAEADLFRLKFTQSNDTMTITHPTYEVRDLTRTGHAAWTLTVVAFEPTQTFPTSLAAAAGGAGVSTYSYQVTAVGDDAGEESLAAIMATTTITGATKANPCVVTSAAHGYANGDLLHIAAIVGMTELNGRRFTVANKAANTYELSGENSTNYTTYSSGGTAGLTQVTLTAAAALSSSVNNTITWAAAASAIKYNIYKEDNGLFGYVGTTEDLTFADDNIAADLTDSPPKQRTPFLGVGNYPATVTYFDQRKGFAGSDNKPTTMYLTQSANFKNLTYSSPRKDDDAITRTFFTQKQNAIRHFVPLTDLIVLTSGAEHRVFAGQSGVITPTSINTKPQSYNGTSHVRPLIVVSTALYIQEQGPVIRDMQYKLETDGYTGSDLSILATHLFYGYTIVDWDYAKSPFSVVWAIRSDGVMLGLTYLREHEIWGWHRHDTKGLYESVCCIEEGTETAVYVIVKRTIGGVAKRFIERFASRTFSDPQDGIFLDAGLSLDVPITITGATAATPVVITATAHGLSNGDVVDIANVKVRNARGEVEVSTEYNATGFIVASAAANTFALTDSNGDSIVGAAYLAYLSGGAARKAVTTVSGLWHLEGETLSALADGNVVTGLTVASGALTLPNAASRVHVGYGYISEIETLNVDITDRAGSSTTGRKRKVGTIAVRLEKTRGLKGGPSRSRLDSFREGMNAPYTGVINISILPAWNTNGKVVLAQEFPLPMTILGIAADIDVGSTG